MLFEEPILFLYVYIGMRYKKALKVLQVIVKFPGSKYKKIYCSTEGKKFVGRFKVSSLFLFYPGNKSKRVPVSLNSIGKKVFLQGSRGLGVGKIVAIKNYPFEKMAYKLSPYFNRR